LAAALSRACLVVAAGGAGFETVVGGGGASAAVSGGGEVCAAVVAGAAASGFFAAFLGTGSGRFFATVAARGAAGFVVVVGAGGVESDGEAGAAGAEASAEGAAAAVGGATDAGAGAAAVDAGAGATVVAVATAVVAVVVAAGSGGNPGMVITMVVIGDGKVTVMGSIVIGDENVGSGVAPPAVPTTSWETQKPATAQDASPAQATTTSARRTKCISARLSVRTVGCGPPRPAIAPSYRRIQKAARSAVAEASG
jgi:hypothetical protein